LTEKNQGLISANCSTFDFIGNKYQENHKDEIQVISLFTISQEKAQRAFESAWLGFFVLQLCF